MYQNHVHRISASLSSYINLYNPRGKAHDIAAGNDEITGPVPSLIQWWFIKMNLLRCTRFLLSAFNGLSTQECIISFLGSNLNHSSIIPSGWRSAFNFNWKNIKDSFIEGVRGKPVLGKMQMLDVCWESINVHLVQR